METGMLFIDDYEFPRRLSRKEAYELLEKIKAGDETAREELIKHNIRLVVAMVRDKFWSVDYQKDELVSIGIVGLIKAVDTFDTAKGVEFSTYASRCINNEILMFLRQLKKYTKDDSLDRVINVNNDGSELKLEDTVGFSVDLVEEYMDNELYLYIDKLLRELPYRDREIIKMYYGFYDGKRYKQEEIAKRFKISRSYTSRIIRRIVDIFRNQFKLKGFIEDDEIDVVVVDNYKIQRMPTIYEYFGQYSSDMVEQMLSMLNEDDRNLITLIYGDDLENPITSSECFFRDNDKYYKILVPKMEQILQSLSNKQKETLSEILPSSIVEESFDMEQPQLSEEINSGISFLVEYDDIKLLELLRNTNFAEMASILTPKEFIIASLWLGYIDGRCIPISDIASFFDIENQEVIDIIMKVLYIYKERLNFIIDRAVQIMDDDKLVLKKSNWC